MARRGWPPRLGAPSAIAITPDGKTAYVTTSDGVIPIATATNTAGPLIAAGDGSGYIAIMPDGTTAYVIDQGSDMVTAIDIATNTAGPSIPVGDVPTAIAITPAVPSAPLGPIVSGYDKTRCVDDSGDSSANDTKIVLAKCNDSAEQNWTVGADGNYPHQWQVPGHLPREQGQQGEGDSLYLSRHSNQQWRRWMGRW